MILDLGLIDYKEAYAIQRALVNKRKLRETEDVILICEHYPVFSIGRSGNRANLLISEDAMTDKGASLVTVDRGGDITFHGPGQIVIYPIIDLRSRGSDLHKYLRDLEGTAINFLREYLIAGERLSGKTGVWVEDEKIASIGIAASGWITYHGMSININTDLSFFSMINPCGIIGKKITSLNQVLGREIGMTEAKRRLILNLRRVFEMEGS